MIDIKSYNDVGLLDWGDRGTADGGSPDSQKGSRSPHIQTTVGVSGKTK